MQRRSFRRASPGSPAPHRRDSGATRSAPSEPLPWPSAKAPADSHSRQASPLEFSARVRPLQWVFQERRPAARAGNPVSALQSSSPSFPIFSGLCINSRFPRSPLYCPTFKAFPLVGARTMFAPASLPAFATLLCPLGFPARLTSLNFLRRPVSAFLLRWLSTPELFLAPH